MRALYGFVFIGLYFCWVIYRGLIKRDLRQHLNDFYGLTFFAGIWTIITYLLFS